MLALIFLSPLLVGRTIWGRGAGTHTCIPIFTQREFCQHLPDGRIYSYLSHHLHIYTLRKYTHLYRDRVYSKPKKGPHMTIPTYTRTENVNMDLHTCNTWVGSGRKQIRERTNMGLVVSLGPEELRNT